MTVKQISNVLDLLEFFARSKKPASLAEIQRQFGWPRSSAYNILTTLVNRGYMYEPKQRGGFYPTPRLMEMAKEVTADDNLSQWLMELLQAMANETGETALIAAPAGRYSVYIEVIESDLPVRYAARVGQRIPIHAAASGRALLAQFSEKDRLSVLRKVNFTQSGPNALTSVEAIEREIRISRERGWCESVNEYDADLASVAIPLTVADRRLALVIAGPAFRLVERFPDIAATMQEQVNAQMKLLGNG